MTDFKMVLLSEIKPDPNQPRKFYDETAMQELTDSVRQKKILQPILIRPIGCSEAYVKIDPAAKMSIEVRRKSGYSGPVYLVVCGERRLKAAMSVNAAFKDRNSIPAVIRELNDEEALELQIIENLQRKDVHPMEEAIAFQSLLEKQKDVKEIGAKVGKGEFYVKQRIKLCALSKPWQAAYWSGRIDNKTALTVATFDEKIQAEMYKERVENYTGAIDLNSFFFNRFRGDLSNAPFSLEDATLDKKAGPCTSCPFNSAVASLFPDNGQPAKCTRFSCFKHKADISFDREVAKAKIEPGMIFVNTEYSGYHDNFTRKIEKDGFEYWNGYGAGNFSVIEPPEKPTIEYFDIDDYASEKERDESFADDLRIYEKNLLAYNEKIAGGKLKRAFAVHGDSIGKYVYLQIGKKSAESTGSTGSSKATKEKEVAGKLTVQDINEEIKRIQDREKRNEEIDTNKIHKSILEQVKKNDKLKKPGLKFQPKVDRGILLFLLLHEEAGSWELRKLKTKLGSVIPKEPGYGKVGYAFDYFKKLGEMSDDNLAFIIRHICIAKWGNPEISRDVKIYDTALRLIADYAGIDIKAIEKEQGLLSAERKTRVSKRISELSEKNKDLSAKKTAPAEKKAPAKKASVKKLLKKNGK